MNTHGPVLKPLNDDHLALIVALNNSALPAVSPLTAAEAAPLMAQCQSVLGQIGDDGALLGLVMLAREGMDYDSTNYAWISARFENFLYVDRIIIAEAARGTGLGRELYEHAQAIARAAGLSLLAEINSDPPNPQSMAFHKRLGFQVIGELQHAPGYAVEFVEWRSL